MDMKKERRRVYLRCFTLLLALWAVLLGALTYVVMSEALRSEGRRLHLEGLKLREQLLSMDTGSPQEWAETIRGFEDYDGVTAALVTLEGEPIWQMPETVGTQSRTAQVSPASIQTIRAMAAEENLPLLLPKEHLADAVASKRLGQTGGRGALEFYVRAAFLVEQPLFGEKSLAGNCWLSVVGKANLWAVAGPQVCVCALVSFLLFLLAAWLLSHATWKGQRTHLLYERRTRETTAAIAHDMKTPLAVIRSCAENLAENVRPEKRNRYIAEIAAQTEAMDRSLADMLELDRLRTCRPQLEEAALEGLIQERLEALAPLLEGLEVSVEAAGAVRADRRQLERLLDNLLRNAADHSAGVIRVRADAQALTVYNSGAPIPAEDLPRLWEPYFKGDTARKGGSGLGLALAAAIAQAHGWHCGAENADGGVIFTVSFWKAAPKAHR